MRGIKIPQYEFALKMQGGGAYLRDTTVLPKGDSISEMGEPDLKF